MQDGRWMWTHGCTPERDKGGIQDWFAWPQSLFHAFASASFLRTGWGRWEVALVSWKVEHLCRRVFSSVQSHSRVRLFVIPWTAALQASLSITNSWSLIKLMFFKSVMPFSHLILCRPLLLPPSIFPSIRVFSNESVLHIRWPKCWRFSFSISPSNKCSGLISFRMEWLQSKKLSRVFSNTTVHKHQFFGAQLSLQSNSHIHTWLLEKPFLWLCLLTKSKSVSLVREKT